jgi:hypothetical protein
MIGVALVGLSGSLIKDVVKEDVVNMLVRVAPGLANESPELPPPEPVETPEATKVLIGEISSLTSFHNLLSANVKVSFSFCLPRFCRFEWLIKLRTF